MQKVILAGPCLGEMYWEFGRFASHVLWRKMKKHKNKVGLIVLTRPERFDMYGEHANILVPLRIEGDGTDFRGDCFRLMKFPHERYQRLINKFNGKYKDRFKIIEHIHPNIRGKAFANKNQFPPPEMIFDQYRPRKENKVVISEMIPNDKPLVVVAPRYRLGLKRNWPHWQKFYDLLAQSKLMDRFYFVLCGKMPDHIPDKHGRFYDINNVPTMENVSPIGLTMECLSRAIFTVGSQSGIPNISLLYKVEVLEWGHQRSLHTQTYNIFKTKITFIDDRKYKIEPENILKVLTKRLKGKGVIQNDESLVSPKQTQDRQDHLHL